MGMSYMYDILLCELLLSSEADFKLDVFSGYGRSSSSHRDHLRHRLHPYSPLRLERAIRVAAAESEPSSSCGSPTLSTEEISHGGVSESDAEYENQNKRVVDPWNRVSEQLMPEYSAYLNESWMNSLRPD